jgi:hypothetical protein
LAKLVLKGDLMEETAESLTRVGNRQATAPYSRASQGPKGGGPIRSLDESLKMAHDIVATVCKDWLVMQEPTHGNVAKGSCAIIPFPASPTQQLKLHVRRRDLDDMRSPVTWSG